jgi:hypothetical protein
MFLYYGKKVLRNRVLRRLTAPDREGGIWAQRKVGLHNEELRNLYSALKAKALIKCKKNIYHGEIRNAHIFVGTSEAKTKLKGN